MKTTQIVMHIMPYEIDDYYYIIQRLYKSMENDQTKYYISLNTTLNLSPCLIDWDNSELSKQFFIDKFIDIQSKIHGFYEIKYDIILDDSILGTTAQKRNAIRHKYDQYIFLDSDIAFPCALLDYMLYVGDNLDGKYIITPQLVKMWDPSWDILVNDRFKHKEYGYQYIHDPELTYNQTINNVYTTQSPYFKFGCGWFTLYSYDILDFIGIPEWLGPYGPEDTFIMFASQYAIQKNYDITQYIINGMYISENYIKKNNIYKDKLSLINLKDKFRLEAENKFDEKLREFYNNLTYNI